MYSYYFQNLLGPQYDMYGRAHDNMDYISGDNSQHTLSNLPVPVGMFMNMAHVPPRFYQQHQQAMAARGRGRGRGGRGGQRGRGSMSGSVPVGNMQLSQPFSQQDPTTQSYSQQGLTQAHLSQVGYTSDLSSF